MSVSHRATMGWFEEAIIMPAKGEIVVLGARSHGPAWDANTHRVVIVDDRPDAFIGVSEGNWIRTKGTMEPCVYPKFAWEVRA